MCTQTGRIGHRGPNIPKTDPAPSSTFPRWSKEIDLSPIAGRLSRRNAGCLRDKAASLSSYTLENSSTSNAALSPWWKHECGVLRGLQSSFAEGNILFQSYFELLTGGVSLALRAHVNMQVPNAEIWEHWEDRTASCLRGSALGYHAACYGGKPSQKVQRYMVICLSTVVSPLPKISPLNRCDRFGQGLKWQTRSPTALGKCCSKPRPLGITNAKESSLGRLEIIHSWKMVEPIRGVRWTKIPSIFALNCWVHEKAITLELHP